MQSKGDHICLTVRRTGSTFLSCPRYSYLSYLRLSAAACERALCVGKRSDTRYKQDFSKKSNRTGKSNKHNTNNAKNNRQHHSRRTGLSLRGDHHISVAQQGLAHVRIANTPRVAALHIGRHHVDCRLAIPPPPHADVDRNQRRQQEPHGPPSRQRRVRIRVDGLHVPVLEGNERSESLYLFEQRVARECRRLRRGV